MANSAKSAQTNTRHKHRQDVVASPTQDEYFGPDGPDERNTVDLASIRIITHDVDRLAPVFAEIRTNSATLAIASTVTVAMLGDQAPKPASNNTIIAEFLVVDVDAEFARLQDGLDDVVLEPTTMPWGNRSTLFRDPDGNLVNLFSRPGL